MIYCELCKRPLEGEKNNYNVSYRFARNRGRRGSWGQPSFQACRKCWLSEGVQLWHMDWHYQEKIIGQSWHRR